MNNKSDNNLDIQVIVVTDLDGTLLDHETYDYTPALEALSRIREQNIPLILASSKTYGEISTLQAELNLEHPAIIENGGGCYIPENYFPAEKEGFTPGTPLSQIIEILDACSPELRSHFRGFCDWTVEQVQEHTGLPKDAALQAMKRDWSVPGLWSGTEADLMRFTKYIEDNNLQLTRGGRFIHIMGQTSKGLMLTWLQERYKEKFPERQVISIALGDAPNDQSMLEASDHAIVIPNSSGNNLELNSQKIKGILHRAEKPGPNGWNETVLRLLNEF